MPVAGQCADTNQVLPESHPHNYLRAGRRENVVFRDTVQCSAYYAAVDKARCRFNLLKNKEKKSGKDFFCNTGAM